VNICTTRIDGTLCEIDPNSARGAASFLAAKLAHVEDREQSGVLRAIRELEFIATPAAHFDVALFTAPGYVPGWVPDP
jgi:hypothetical protein